MFFYCWVFPGFFFVNILLSLFFVCVMLLHEEREKRDNIFMQIRSICDEMKLNIVIDEAKIRVNDICLKSFSGNRYRFAKSRDKIYNFSSRKDQIRYTFFKKTAVYVFCDAIYEVELCIPLEILFFGLANFFLF